ANAAGYASAQATLAATEAALAARAAQDAVTAPPAPPPPARVVPTGPTEPLVTFTSSPSNSIVGDYKIDFTAMDSNGNGSISRSEARSNATLTGEFDAVDNNSDGKLDRQELGGWMERIADRPNEKARERGAFFRDLGGAISGGEV